MEDPLEGRMGKQSINELSFCSGDRFIALKQSNASINFS